MVDTPNPAREEARKHIEERRGFAPHLIVYLAFNTSLVLIWAYTTKPGFFWPGIIIAAWGIGVLMHAWSAFFRKPITEEDVDRELTHWRSRPGQS
ncbi:2TM domain-containing protein [Streptosporangiaceae bacterium NEAU-GS5]|nr:2TM domain-containing protein [Streptosporangiaceae bacterium NEAU-GS5]